MITGLRTVIFATLAWGQLFSPGALQAQFDRPLAGEVAERKIDQLRLDDSLLRTEINSAQIARQAEITRLEGRILQLEEQLRDLPRDTGTTQFAFVLGLAVNSAAEHQLESARQAELEQTEDVAESDVLQGVKEKARTEEDASFAERKGTEEDARFAERKGTEEDASFAERNATAREIVVHDFMLTLEIELLDARSRLLEKSREVKSLERLSSKGLATAAQLELQVMQRRRAELQVQRFEKQIAGVRRIYPGYFPQ